jgi:hypothetical protein
LGGETKNAGEILDVQVVEIEEAEAGEDKLEAQERSEQLQ